MKTNIVLSTINKYNMIADSKNIVVGFSGGADSVCLLHILYSLKEKLNLKIFACHLNHMLRGEEAERDEEFCIDFCKNLNIPIEVKRLNINELALSQKKSVELCAREKRYEFFCECAKKYDGLIATAHTKSDSIETVVFNMLRGTALKGLCGIPPKRDNIIRPLIDFTREDVEEYCKENSLDFVSDSTNFTDIYKRNFIRHNIIPLLKQESDNFYKIFSNMTFSLSNDEDFLEKQTVSLVESAFNGRCYNCEVLLNAHPSLIYRAVGYILRTKSITVDFKKISSVVDMLTLENAKQELSEDLFVIIKDKQLCFEKSVNLQQYFEVEIKPNQDNMVFEGKKIKLCEENKEKLLTFLKLPKKDLKNLIDCGKINGVLVARQRKGKDEIELLGRKCHKSLKKLFNEQKIDLDKRSQTIVITNNEKVVWVEGFGVSEDFCVDENTNTFYKVQII